MVDNGFVHKSIRLGEKYYSSWGLFYAWSFSPKKYCLEIDDFGIISGKKIFEGYSGEQRMMKLNEYISLSEGKTVSGRFSIHSTKTIEGVKIRHRKQDCSDCDNGKFCSDCVIKP